MICNNVKLDSAMGIQMTKWKLKASGCLRNKCRNSSMLRWTIRKVLRNTKAQQQEYAKEDRQR
uniref:Uncharacterized protein n=1 Tax=Arundo donax TaxID=35708 RepID=A0A0A9G868_ARUDO